MQTMYSLIGGIRQSLRSPHRKYLFAGLLLLIFAVLFSIPILTIPGNSFAIQSSITQWRDVAVFLLLSSLLSLLVVLQLERRRCGKACRSSTAAMVGMGSTGVVGTALAGLLGTAACSSCLVGILGIVGIGTTVAFALLDYRWYVVWSVILLCLLFIVLTARKIHSSLPT